MSAPIVVIAVVGAAPLLFKSSTSIPFVDCGACGYVGEGEHFPAFRARSGGGGSTAGRQRRSSTYTQAFLVHLTRCAIAEALVLALDVVKVQPGVDTGLGFGHGGIGMEIDLLVFGRW